jgi:hypothetical protein
MLYSSGHDVESLLVLCVKLCLYIEQEGYSMLYSSGHDVESLLVLCVKLC